MKKYSGIGARQTPDKVLTRMFDIGVDLASKGYTLRSGAAQGADETFEAACDSVNGAKEIFLPWKDFRGHKSQFYTPPEFAFYLIDNWWPKAASFHHGMRKLWARNFQQVLGNDILNPDPVDFVICWTADGKASGGTGIAIQVAEHFNIPVINLKTDAHLVDMLEW